MRRRRPTTRRRPQVEPVSRKQSARIMLQHPPAEIGPLQTTEGTGAKVFALLAIVLLSLPLILSLFIDPIVAWVIGGGAVMVMALCSIICYALACSSARRIAQLRDGELLYRWRFEPTEWKRFAQQEWLRIRTESLDWKEPLIAAVVGGVIGAIVAWQLNPGIGFLLGFMGLLSVALFGNWSMWIVGRNAWRRSCRRMGDVLIDRQGVFYNGRFYYWALFGVTIESAEVIPGQPAVLQVHTRQQAGSRKYRHEIRVPVPAGRETEAHDVVARLLGC
jgi:hypothetical protein